MTPTQTEPVLPERDRSRSALRKSSSSLDLSKSASEIAPVPQKAKELDDSYRDPGARGSGDPGTAGNNEAIFPLQPQDDTISSLQPQQPSTCDNQTQSADKDVTIHTKKAKYQRPMLTTARWMSTRCTTTNTWKHFTTTETTYERH